MAYSAQELQDILHYQIGALDGICRAQGGRVSYVKPHGAMYNDMMANPAQLRAVLQAVAAYDSTLPLMLMATRDNSAAQRDASQRQRAASAELLQAQESLVQLGQQLEQLSHQLHKHVASA